MNIVVIEDEGITAYFLQESINELGHEVVAMFDNGNELLNFLQKKSVDLIFMDINIKGSLDGVQLANIINEKYPSVLFVFLTSIKDSETIKSAQRVKPLGYLIKPIIASDLEAIMMVVEAHDKEIIENVDICLGEYRYNLNTKILSKDCQNISLGKNASLCLHTLVMSRNNYISGDQLTNSIWMGDKNDNTSLRELIFRLRKKLPDLPLTSTPNLGYMISSI